jgi:uncharacterized protein YbjT (DUF2867 family)
VVRHLLSEGFTVRALVRNRESPAAQSLARQHVEVVPGDFSSAESLNGALSGVQGVFSVQPFLRGKAALEYLWGKHLADAARYAGVEHFIYSSVHGADAAPDVSHFASKARIEEYIRAIKLPATILRPAGFMENLLMSGVQKGISRGSLTTPIAVDVPQPLIAVDDIGFIATKAFSAPERYVSRIIPLVGDVASVRDQAATLSRIRGRDIKPRQLPGLIVRLVLGGDLYRMFRWVETTGNRIPFNIDELRSDHPGLMTFEDWARRNLT